MKLQIIHIDSLQEYLKNIFSIRDQWSKDQDCWCDPWFRGQADAKDNLRPGLYRYKTADENDLRREFKLRAIPLFNEKVPQNDWELYFMMQHFGVPTRLLDWTEGALQGLYFALRFHKEKTDAAVWVLDPSWLNKIAVGTEGIFEMTDIEAKNYLSTIGKKKKLPDLPLAILPPHIAERIAVQKACFTIHGSNPDGFDSVLTSGQDGRLIKMVVPANKIKTVKKDIQTSGVSESALFPDLDGLGRELREDWCVA